MSELPLASPIARAMPKSATIAWPLESRMFSGLMSRWMMPRLMRVVQRFGDLAAEQQRLRDRQAASVRSRSRRVSPSTNGMTEYSRPAASPESMQRQDVGVLKLGRDPDLAEEPLAGDGGHDARAQHLDGDLAAELPVARQEHGRHPAPPRLALNCVAVPKRLA